MIVDNKQFAIEKVIACTITLGFIAVLSPYHVMHAFVVLGHAHFILSYWYQYKAGKVRAVYIVPFILAAAFFLYLTYAVSLFFILFVMIFFLFHNYFDEFKLNGYRASVEYLGIIILIISFLTGWFLEFFTNAELTRSIVMGGVVVTVLLYGMKAFMSGLQWPLKSSYMWFLLLMLGLFAFLEFSGSQTDVRYTIGGVILIHYFSWYIRLGVKFYKASKCVFNIYLVRVFIANVVLIAGYFIVVVALDKNNVLYPLFYRPLAFYAWTLLHLITTFRLTEYKSALNFSK